MRLHAARRPVRRRDPDRQGFGLGPLGADLGHDFQRVTHAVGQRSTVLVGSPIGERRNERAQQIPVSQVQLQHVEPGSGGHVGGADEVGSYLVHVAPGHLPGRLVVGPVGDGRRRDQRPVPFGERLVLAFPGYAGGAFSARVRQLDADLGLALAVHELHDPPPPGHVGREIHPGAAGGDPALPAHVGHLGHHQPGAADRAAGEVNQVPIIGKPVIRPVLAHRGDYDPVRQHQLAEPIGREQWRRGGIDRHGAPALPAGLLGEPAVHLPHQSRIAKPQVFMGDAETSGEQVEGELERLGVMVALRRFEPLEARLSRPLEALHLWPPAGLVAGERIGN